MNKPLKSGTLLLSPPGEAIGKRSITPGKVATKARGTGLGLASSRATMEAHEGSIGFEEVEPTGSRFWFRLPIVTC